MGSQPCLPKFYEYIDNLNSNLCYIAQFDGLQNIFAPP